ncbi:MAG: hypothetical protein IJU90_01775 [Bacteroidales bacterium]|nr:hypothetical protein [Bacteroidales bacterium]
MDYPTSSFSSFLKKKKTKAKEEFKAVKKKLKNDYERLKSANSHWVKALDAWGISIYFYYLTRLFPLFLLRHTDFLTPFFVIFLNAFSSRPRATQVSEVAVSPIQLCGVWGMPWRTAISKT